MNDDNQTIEDKALLSMGIQFRDKNLIEEYYRKLNGIFITEVLTSSHAGMILDVGSLPEKPYPFKEIFIKWLIEINLPRIESGNHPIISYEVIMRCPLWRVISPPLKRMTLTKEGMFGKPSIQGTIGKSAKIGSINKRKK